MKRIHINDDHIRSEIELQQQLEGLIEIYDIFKSLNVPMFLSAGTMLGAIRGGDFIAWDWNVSVGCRAEEFNPVLNKFLELMANKGFESRLIRQGEYIRVNALKNNITFIIENLVLIGVWRTRRHYKCPAQFIKKFDTAKIRGVEFPVPHPMLKVVAWQYGPDWQTPKHVKSRGAVINPEHRIRKKDGLKRAVKRLMK